LANQHVIFSDISLNQKDIGEPRPKFFRHRKTCRGSENFQSALAFAFEKVSAEKCRICRKTHWCLGPTGCDRRDSILKSSCSVTIHLSGDNFITATRPDSPGIDCQSNSQVGFSESAGWITVTGGASAPGIGAPRGRTCDSLFFSSGTSSVTASGGSRINSIVIDGGSVTATARQGAAIGAGYAPSSVGTVRIQSGTVVAVTGYGAGVGEFTVGDIAITGGIVTASAEQGAGISAGARTSGRSDARSIAISGATVDASSDFGSGIGRGHAQNGSASVDRVTIHSGEIVAALRRGSGIGGGYSVSGTVANASVGSISI
jgi:hypothetical protein